MASTAKDLRYRNEYPVSGSLAHDLDWEIRERQLRHAGETPRRRVQEETRTLQKTKTQVHVQLRERQEVSYVAIAGFALVIGLAVMVLLSYIQLTVLSGETVALKNELSQLQTQNVSLRSAMWTSPAVIPPLSTSRRSPMSWERLWLRCTMASTP